MRIDPEAEMRAILEPSHEELGRIVAAALEAPVPRARATSPVLVSAAAVAVLAILVTYARQEPSFTEPLPVAPVVAVTNGVSNSGAVMLVRRPSGRTLVVNRSAGARGTDEQTPYRIMISKGTVP
jgi:hypothetical protein